jgi:single-stranded-DNA-specific exonuclease
MDDNVQLPPNLFTDFSKAAEAVRRAVTVRVISHNDADGLASAGVLCAMLLRECKQFQCTMAKGFDEKLVRETTKDVDLLIISDMGSNNLDVLQSLSVPVIVLDHHRPEKGGERLLHLNPHLYGIDGAISGCASSLAMLLAVHVSEKNWDLLWVAFGGIIGDKQHLRGLSGINIWLYQNGAKRKLVQERPGQLIVDGSLKDALNKTTDPFIMGVSGDREGVRRLLDEADVLDNLPYESLDEGQRMRLNSLIMLRLLRQGSTIGNFEEVLANRYYFPDQRQFSQDLANALNACGKSERQSLGVAMLLGEVEAAKDAERMRGEFGESLLHASVEVSRKGLIQGSNIQYFICPNPDVSSEACSVMMQWVGDREKPTLSLVHKNGEVKVSSRANRKMVDELGVDLGAAMKEAAAKVGGVGGGHNIASGGRVPRGREEEFLQSVDDIVGQQKALKASSK